VGSRVKIEPAKAEPGHDFEPLCVPITASRILDGFHLRVYGEREPGVDK